MNPKDFQDSLKPLMRQQELQRRATREAIIKNHIKLADDMTEKEKATYKRGLNDDKRGYFKRLWDAIRGQ